MITNETRLYLIQSGKIASSEVYSQNVPLADAIRFDYLGSAEYEFGAIPSSFDRMMYSGEVKVFKFEDFKNENNESLYVFSSRDEDQIKTYVTLLDQLRHGKPGANKFPHRLKESCGFTLDEVKQKYRHHQSDFWWDLQHDIMFTFNADFAEHALKLISNQAYIRENRS